MTEIHEFLTAELPKSPRDLALPERRIAQRNSLSLRANLTIPGRSILPGRILDISRGGASMIMPFELSSGQQCYIDFELEACGDTSAFHIAAEVRYSVELDKRRFRVGLRFGEMDEKTTALIDALLHSSLK
jgi:c-di-GMP-binding flagellar brake protein YcgR